MEKLLFINGCVRGAQSRTLALARCFLRAFGQRYPGLRINTVDLNGLRLQPLYEDTLEARNAATGNWDATMFELARAFRDADWIVMAAPFWEGTFPAALHTYLEHICVFVTTRGGIYEQGDAVRDDHAAPLLASMLRMLGIQTLHTVAAEGLDIQGFDAQGALDAACARAVALAQSL